MRGIRGLCSPPSYFLLLAATATYYDACTFTVPGYFLKPLVPGVPLFILNNGAPRICAVHTSWYDGTTTWAQVCQKLEDGPITVYYDPTGYNQSFPGYKPSAVYHFESAAKTFYDSTANAFDQDASGMVIRGTLGPTVPGGKMGGGLKGWNSPGGCLTGLLDWSLPSWCCRAFVKFTTLSELDLMNVGCLEFGNNESLKLSIGADGLPYIQMACAGQSPPVTTWLANTGAATAGIWQEVVWGRNNGVWTIALNGQALTTSQTNPWPLMVSYMPPATHTPLMGRIYDDRVMSGGGAGWFFSGPPANVIVDELIVWKDQFPPLALINRQVAAYGPNER